MIARIYSSGERGYVYGAALHHRAMRRGQRDQMDPGIRQRGDSSVLGQLWSTVEFRIANQPDVARIRHAFGLDR